MPGNEVKNQGPGYLEQLNPPLLLHLDAPLHLGTSGHTNTLKGKDILLPDFGFCFRISQLDDP